MKLTMKQWSWEILPCQDDRQVLGWSKKKKKKVIIPEKSKAGLNITRDASRCSAFILADPRRGNTPKNRAEATIQAAACCLGSC